VAQCHNSVKIWRSAVVSLSALVAVGINAEGRGQLHGGERRGRHDGLLAVRTSSPEVADDRHARTAQQGDPTQDEGRHAHPDGASVIRLVASILMETNDDWIGQSRYLNMSKEEDQS